LLVVIIINDNQEFYIKKNIQNNINNDDMFVDHPMINCIKNGSEFQNKALKIYLSIISKKNLDIDQLYFEADSNFDRIFNVT